MGDTTIEWTDKTWNPVSGCSKVSQGCKNCYAERVFDRAYAKDQWPIGDGTLRRRFFTDVECHENRLEYPLHWRKPQRIFVNSMSDLFHDDVPDEFIDQVFAIMALCPQHTFQILTKRPERMMCYLNSGSDDDAIHWACEITGSPCAAGAIEDAGWPLKNVWLGVSVEDQATADERIPLLLQTPAAVRWLSCEPLLGPIDLSPWLSANSLHKIDGGPRIDWVVVGGESGPGARPMHPDWARSIREQCAAAGTEIHTASVKSSQQKRS